MAAKMAAGAGSASSALRFEKQAVERSTPSKSALAALLVEGASPSTRSRSSSLGGREVSDSPAERPEAVPVPPPLPQVPPASQAAFRCAVRVWPSGPRVRVTLRQPTTVRALVAAVVAAARLPADAGWELGLEEGVRGRSAADAAEKPQETEEEEEEEEEEEDEWLPRLEGAQLVQQAGESRFVLRPRGGGARPSSAPKSPASGCAELELVLGEGASEAKSEAAGAGIALLAAARSGNVEAVRQLLEREGADANAAGPDGWTALHYAAAENRLGVVHYLLKACEGLRIDARARGGFTPLYVATRAASYEAAEALLTCGADAAAACDAGPSVSDAALRSGRPDMCELLAEFSGGGGGGGGGASS